MENKGCPKYKDRIHRATEYSIFLCGQVCLCGLMGLMTDKLKYQLETGEIVWGESTKNIEFFNLRTNRDE